MFKGKNLKALRMIEGCSRKSLADVLQVSEQAVWQYEVQNKMPEIKTIYTLAKWFGVKASFFFSFQEVLFKGDVVERHTIACRYQRHCSSTKILSQNHGTSQFLCAIDSSFIGLCKATSPSDINISKSN